LKESRSEWELEDATHKRQKEAHELQVQSHSEALLAHDALLKSLDSELKLSKQFCELIPKQIGFMDDEKKEENQQDENEGDLAQLQAEVVKCEAAVSEAKILLKAATSAITNLEAERDSLRVKIPELEALKKEAATKRDFKAASKASKEIKDATARLKECEEELDGEAASKKKAAEEELNRLDAELVKTRELSHAKEKVSGQEKMAALAKKIAQLIEKKKDICGECSSDENNVRGVGALVLEGQIKALKAEGKDLGSKFGGWKELMKDIDAEDADSSSLDGSTEADQVAGENCEKAQDVKSSQVQDPIPAPDDGLTVEERVKKVKGLIMKMKEVEQALEVAVSQEEFDVAAELQEEIDNLATQIAEIDVPEDVLEMAISEDSSGDAELAPQSEAAEEVEDEEEKKDTADEDAALSDEVAVEQSEKAEDDNGCDESASAGGDDEAEEQDTPVESTDATSNGVASNEDIDAVPDEDDGVEPTQEHEISVPDKDDAPHSEIPEQDDAAELVVESVATDDTAG